MLEKYICPHCQTPIEFDVAHVNTSIDCPNCAQQIRLQIFTKPVPPPPKPNPVAPVSKVMPCEDCGSQISRRALFCPSCGAYKDVPFRLVVRVVAWLALLSIIGSVIGWILLQMATH